MALWLVRAGGRGEREEFALDNGLAVVGWSALPDLSVVKSREELLFLLETVYSGEGRKRLMNWQSQLWPFISTMVVGDLVALPLKHRPAVAIGRIIGPYRYRPENPVEAQHTRGVS